MTTTETVLLTPNIDPSPTAEGLPALDTMLDATRLHQLFTAPEVIADQSISDGYKGDVGTLHTEITELRDRAIREIAVPATVAERARQAEAHVREGATDFLARAQNDLEQAGNQLTPVRRGIDTIEEQLQTANRAMLTLEQALYGTGAANKTQLDTAVHNLETFRQVYEPAVVTIQQPYEDATTGIKVSAHHVNLAGGVAEDGRQHLAGDKAKLEADPGKAYYEGIEEAVGSRGASTVAEHATMCETEYEGSMDKIADLRDECAGVHGTLARIAADLPGGAMAKNLPGGRAIGDAINGLRVAGYHAGERGVSAQALESVLYEVKRQLRLVADTVTGIAQAQPQDKMKLQQAKEAVVGLLQSELLQAA